MKNFHEFVHEYLQKPEFTELMRRLGALGDGRHDQSTLSQDEWEVSYLYLAFVLRKVSQHSLFLILLTSELPTQFGNIFHFSQRGQPPSQRRSNNANRGKMFLNEGDIEFLGI
jgi:mRNA (guanine-N7-)-methyltransferase